MKKIRIFLLSLLCALTVLFSFNFNISVKVLAEEKIYLGGFPAGFSIDTKGAYVVGISDVVTLNGIKSPAKDIGIQAGDIILSINGTETNTAYDVGEAIKDGKNSIIIIDRNGKKIIKELIPEKDSCGEYKLGVFIKDGMNGIGTITFIKGNKFASLGHAVINEKGNIIDILGGNLYNCYISNVIKGERGNPGELCGNFNKDNCIGKIAVNTACGVFGSLNKNFDYSSLSEIELGTPKSGDAEIISTIEGDTPKKYSVSIVKYDNNATDNKNFVLKITDKTLVEKTGGIVQGMSGSPIIQNGKLVGAVTHVFINDSTRGFGISVYKMLNNL